MKTLLMTALTLAPIAYVVFPDMGEPVLNAILPISPLLPVLYMVAIEF